MTTPENPPAFPRPGSVDNFGDYPIVREAHEGMTLRDYFAAQAMAGMIALKIGVGETARNHESERRTLAKTAFGIADAMLAARSKP